MFDTELRHKATIQLQSSTKTYKQLAVIIKFNTNQLNQDKKQQYNCQVQQSIQSTSSNTQVQYNNQIQPVFNSTN